MRILPLLLGAGLAVPLAPPGSELATDYGRPRTLATTAELEIDLETTVFEMTIDGEPAEGRGPGGGGSSLVRRSVVLDQVLAGAAGAPQQARRTFEALRDESRFSFGEEERTDEREFPLQGLVLALERDAEGEVTSELVEGSAPEDDALLEGHPLALPFDALLPADAIEAGAKWELDDAAVEAALASVLDARLFPAPPPDESGGGPGERRGSGRGRGGPARDLATVEWTGKAELAALDEEHDGVACARIVLVLEGRGDLPEREMGARGGRGFAFVPAGAAPALAGTVTVRLEGELLIAREARRPLALELDGTLEVDSTSEREREGSTMTMHSVRSGRMTVTAKVEER
jgi:hypothetical protein